MSADLRHACAKHLSYDRPQRAADILRALADYAGDTRIETLGHGGFGDQLTEKVRLLLGADAAVFMPSGRTAQNIAFKLWCARRGFPTIAVHPRSHIEQVTDKSYAHVFGLQA